MPNRSPESIERRKAYTRAWRVAHPEYHARWAADHRAAENERSRRWKADHPDAVRAQRRRYRLAYPTPEPAPILFLHGGHPLFDAALAIVPRVYTGFLVFVTREESLTDDLRSEAVLAILEGRDPAAAVKATRTRELGWIHHTVHFTEDPPENFDA